MMKRKKQRLLQKKGVKNEEEWVDKSSFCIDDRTFIYRDHILSFLAT